MTISSILELFSIGSIIPLISTIIKPNEILNNPNFSEFFKLVGINSEEKLFLLSTVSFSVLAIASGIFRLFILRCNSRFTFETGAELSLLIYYKALKQPYSYHISSNSSEIISGVINKISSAITVITMFMNLLTISIIVIGITFFLLILNPLISLLALFAFSTIYASIIYITKRRIRLNSEMISDGYTKSIKVVQESLGGIREIIIDGNFNWYSHLYRKSSYSLRLAQAELSFLSASPKYIVEAAGLSFIAALAFFMTQHLQADFLSVIATLGVIVFSSQRLLPLLQQIYSSYTVIKGEQASFRDAIEYMDLCDDSNMMLSPRDIYFKEKIVFENVGFSYDGDDKNVLKNISFEIKKGSCIGIVGETGSGKSTLLDILMGLLIPSAGVMEIDGLKIDENNIIAWRRHISHVPQSIFLVDGTIAENIAFGLDFQDVDQDRLQRAALKAQLQNLIESLSDGYKSLVGERGIKLSGGQRQRIGIARAFYKQADVLILDEATSALDNETEKLVMQAVERRDENLTVFMVAHRLTSLSVCDFILEIKDGKLHRKINYQELIEGN